MPEYEFRYEDCKHSFSLIMRVSEYDKKDFFLPEMQMQKGNNTTFFLPRHTTKKS